MRIRTQRNGIVEGADLFARGKLRARGGIGGENEMPRGGIFAESRGRRADDRKKVMRVLPLKMGYAEKNLQNFNRKVLIHSGDSICSSSRHDTWW